MIYIESLEMRLLEIENLMGEGTHSKTGQLGENKFMIIFDLGSAGISEPIRYSERLDEVHNDVGNLYMLHKL